MDYTFPIKNSNFGGFLASSTNRGCLITILDSAKNTQTIEDLEILNLLK